MRDEISTPKAPKAIGPYSQAVRVSEPSRIMFLSGQIPLNPDTGEMVSGSVEDEARQVLKNLAAVAEAGSFTMADVVRTTIYLTDMGDFAKVNGVYAEYFTHGLPARATVAVKALPRSARVEIDAVCLR